MQVTPWTRTASRILEVPASISKRFVWRVPGRNSSRRSLFGSTASRRTHLAYSSFMVLLAPGNHPLPTLLPIGFSSLNACLGFDHSQMAERQHQKVFSTIAKDHANHNRLLRRQLAVIVRDNDALKSMTDILQQWEELIMKPAKALSETMMGPIVIIVDALDECGDTDSRRVFLRILGNAMAGRRITDLPPKHPDPSHVPTFTRHPRSTQRWDACPAEVHGHHRLSQRDMTFSAMYPTSWPKWTLRDRVRKSSLPLLSHPVKYSSGHDWPVHIRGDNDTGTGLDPHERSNAIIDRSKANHVALLDGMHKFTLETMFPQEQPPDQRDPGSERFKSVMAQILGTMEPLCLGSLTSMRCHFRTLKFVGS